MGGGERNDGLCLATELCPIHADSGLSGQQAGQQVIQVVKRGAGAQVPLEPVQHNQLPLPDLLQADGEVRVHDELLAGNRRRLLELGGEEEADSAEELQLGLADATAGQEAVHEAHGKAEDLGLAAQLLAHLQHPVSHNLAHVRLDVRLHVAEVVRLHRHVPDNRGK